MSTTLEHPGPVDIPPPDPEDYELTLFDNQSYRKPARIGVKINGLIWLDPSQDAALIAQLEPGATVNWSFEGLCVGGGSRVIMGSDGVVSGTQFLGAVNIHSVYQA